MYQGYIKKPRARKSRILTIMLLLLAAILGFYYMQNPPLHPPGSGPFGISLNASGTSQSFEEGTHYKKISASITTKPEIQQFIAKDPGKIQVIAFFSYACAWCQRLHPYINTWVTTKPQNVVFYRMPVIFNAGWDVLAKAYYMVDALGRSSSLDDVFFKAVQEEHLNLADQTILQAFFEKQGVSNEQFLELYNSFAVNQSYKQAQQISDAYQVTLSPSLIVNTSSGSYFISASSTGGTLQSVIDVLEHVVAKESNIAGE